MSHYFLPESAFTVTGTVDLVEDRRPGASRLYYGPPEATVSQAVRADISHGGFNLEFPSEGDTDWSTSLTSDGRLQSVSYKSVGVGSKVIAAGGKVLASVVGTALALATGGPALAAEDKHSVATGEKDGKEPKPGPPPDEDEVRRLWDTDNAKASDHRDRYKKLADAATDQLLKLRESVGTDEDVFSAGQTLRRVRQLQDLVEVALAEVSKVDDMYAAWCRTLTTHIPQTETFVLALDELPVHEDWKASTPRLDQTAGDEELTAVWREMWERLGLWVEVGSTPTGGSWKPDSDGTPDGLVHDTRVYWRVPRPARLWVWRRDAHQEAVLDRVVDTVVTDRYSRSNFLQLEGRFFGESSIDVVFDDIGQPSKLAQANKSATGAIADALAAIPDQVVAGLDAASKATTSIADLGDASAERRLKAIKRQVDQKAKELELQGLSATAESYAELKSLEQQVAIATAQGSLAPPSELSRLENRLAKETAERDLEAVTRDRRQASDLAALTAEIATLQAEAQVREYNSKLNKAK